MHTIQNIRTAIISLQCVLDLLTDVISDLYHFVNPITKRHSPIISDEFNDIVSRNTEVNHRNLTLKCFGL